MDFIINLKKIKALKYKHRPFNNWSLEDIHGNESIIYLKPILNREGWYYNRITRFSWYEYLNEDGIVIAYTTRNCLWKTFEYELKIFNHTFLLDKEVKAIKVLWSKLSSEMKELYWLDRDCKYHRDVYRDSSKRCLQSLKEVKLNG